MTKISTSYAFLFSYALIFSASSFDKIALVHKHPDEDWAGLQREKQREISSPGKVTLIKLVCPTDWLHSRNIEAGSPE